MRAGGGLIERKSGTIKVFDRSSTCCKVFYFLFIRKAVFIFNRTLFLSGRSSEGLGKFGWKYLLDFSEIKNHKIHATDLRHFRSWNITTEEVENLRILHESTLFYFKVQGVDILFC